MLLPVVAKNFIFIIDCYFLELFMYWGGHVHLALEDAASNFGACQNRPGEFFKQCRY